MNFIEDTWEDRDGTLFFLQGWEPENGTPKALVALVHGLGEHAVPSGFEFCSFVEMELGHRPSWPFPFFTCRLQEGR